MSSRNVHPSADKVHDSAPTTGAREEGTPMTELALEAQPDHHPMTTPQTIRVLLCDDHAIVREGLRVLLDGVDGIEVVGSASDGAEAVEAAARLRPDVVLMDLVMPKVDGVTATRSITAWAPDARVVALTSFAGNARVLEALDAGAIGYVLKDAHAADVVRAIRVAAAGGAPLDPRAARAVLRLPGEGDPLAGLSLREQEVLRLVATGLTNQVIARQLGISDTTVKAHLTRIYRQIGVVDRTQAALWAGERGLADPEGI
jgi:DNA-binding NarL/FixJ family response regulator